MYKNRGFTLIELLVVVSIISLLSSIVSVSVTSARVKAQDSAATANVESIRTAVLAYKIDNNGKVPLPVSGSGTTVFDNDGSSDFRNSLQPLVDGGYLSQLPSSNLGLFYYALSGSGEYDAVIGATLKTKVPSTVGAPGSCRPFTEPSGGDGQQGQVLPASIGLEGELGEERELSNDELFQQQEEQLEVLRENMFLHDSEGDDPPAAYCSSTLPNPDYCLCI